MSTTTKTTGHPEEKRKLPEGWKWVKLGEVARLINGKAYRADELLEKGKYPVLRVGNLFTSDHWYYSNLELDPEKYCESGDLLYAWSASFGPFIWSGPKVIYHYHIWKILCSETMDSRFAVHALQVLTERIRRESHGLAMLHMTKDGMEKFEIPLPPLAEQQRIAALLHDQMAAVDKARTAAQVRLDAIKDLPAAYLRQVFPQPGQPLPDGWKWVKLGEVCERIDYGFTASAARDIDYPKFLRITDIQDGKVDWLKVPGCNILAIQEIDYELHDGDIVFARTGATTGKSFLLREPPRSIFASYLIRLRAIPQAVLPDFLAAFFHSNGYWQQVSAGVRGGAQGGFNASMLKKLKIPLPSLSEQQRIAAVLHDQMASVEKARAAAEAELETIKALPAALLRRAFAGGL